MLKNRPYYIAHRGLESIAPENTLVSFILAIEKGADGVELDVQLTKDNQVVVIHDITIDRTTNGTGKVKDKTLAQLKQLDAGSWFGSKFSKVKIPSLEEVLRMFHGKENVILIIELKNSGLFSKLPRKVVGLINYYNMERQIYVASFNLIALWHTKNLNPRIRTSLLGLYSDRQDNLSKLVYGLKRFFLMRFPKFIKANVIDIVDIPESKFNLRLVKKLKTKGYQVSVSALRHKRLDAKLYNQIKSVADLIITDNPLLFQKF